MAEIENNKVRDEILAYGMGYPEVYMDMPFHVNACSIKELR